MHHNYGVISGRHFRRLRVAYNFGCRALYTFRGEQVLVVISMGVRRNFSRGGQCQHFANPCQVADDAMQMYVHETPFFTRLNHKENAPCYDNSHKNELVWQP